MNKALQSEVRKVEEAIIRCHRIPIQAEPGELWQRRVMSSILEESASASVEPENGGKLGGLIWRCALVGSLAAMLLVAYAVRSDSNAQYELAELSITDSPALDVVASFGLL
jgi:hypothetical protein